MKNFAFSLASLGLLAISLAAPAPSHLSKSCKKKGNQSQATLPDVNNGTSSHDLTIPSGCLTKNGLAVGWLPDEDDGGKMGPIVDKVGGEACFYGLYSQITSADKYDASQLTSRIDDIKASGAVLQAAVMPTKVRFSEVDSNLAGQVCSSMKTFTDQGIEVWLRFAHEFNWYVTDGTYAGGSPAEFVSMWKTLASACRENDKIKMYWSPNSVGDNVASLDQWWPGAENVDVVGIDVYPKAGTDFAGAYGAFYKAFAGKYNKPFYIGETGQTEGDEAKKAWLKDIVNPGDGFPLYGGFSWFEYYKQGQDFRVALGDENIAKQVLG